VLARWPKPCLLQVDTALAAKLCGTANFSVLNILCILGLRVTRILRESHSCIPCCPVQRAADEQSYNRRYTPAELEAVAPSSGLGIWASCMSDAATDSLVKGWDSSCNCLALGAGYFVVEEDGSTWWRGAPTPLHNKVNGRQKSLPPVDYVALGPADSYFVQFEDGAWQFSADAPEDLVSLVLRRKHGPAPGICSTRRVVCAVEGQCI
jgi:hypothetical protein